MGLLATTPSRQFLENDSLTDVFLYSKRKVHGSSQRFHSNSRPCCSTDRSKPSNGWGQRGSFQLVCSEAYPWARIVPRAPPKHSPVLLRLKTNFFGGVETDRNRSESIHTHHVLLISRIILLAHPAHAGFAPCSPSTCQVCHVRSRGHTTICLGGGDILPLHRWGSFLGVERLF